MTGARPGLDGDGLEDAGLRAVASALDRYAGAASPAVPEALTSRILAAVAIEAPPSPVRRVVDAAAPSRWSALPAALRDLVAVALGVGRPVAATIRAEAVALVLVLALIVVAGGTLAAGGAGALLTALSAPRPGSAAPAVVGPSTAAPNVTPERSAPSTAPSPAVSPRATARPEGSHAGAGAGRSPAPALAPAATPAPGRVEPGATPPTIREPDASPAPGPSAEPSGEPPDASASPGDGEASPSPGATPGS